MWLFLILPLALCQNPYGPSQLDQYNRLLNSGNLGGFGFLNNAIQKGTIRGFADLGDPSRLQGLPPLPLTHEEVVRQLTSTASPLPTRPTSRPTPPPTPAPPMMGIYAINPIPEMPPVPEERLHGHYNEDGMFVPDKKELPPQDKRQLRRNHIQGTKIREIQPANEGRNGNYNRQSSQQNRGHTNYARKFFTNTVKVDQESGPQSYGPRQQFQGNNRLVHRQAPLLAPQQILDPPQPQNQQFPRFVYQPKPAAQGRDPAITNLLTEIEEYDDFLDQRQSYLERYPSATVRNPYEKLPNGQLPTIERIKEFLPTPAEKATLLPPHNNFNFNSPFNNPMNLWNHHHEGLTLMHPPQLPAPPHFPLHTPNPATNPFQNFLNLFHMPHPHAHGARTLTIDNKSDNKKSGPKPNNQPLLMPPPNVGLVDIHQHPLGLPRMPTNMLNIPLVFGR